VNGPRCSATTKAGKPCQALAGSDGLCAAHSGRQDMRALGRKGGKRAHGIKAERVHESLRSYLKREVPPERVWQALEAAMLGNNESARVSASRVLMDALAEPQTNECPHCSAEPIRVDKDVTAEQAADVIEMLVELGVLDWKVEELAQKRAEELTRAFREEHGLPAAPVA
jgi:hypothetical protein